MAILTRYSNKELLTLPDCKGLLESGRCGWLDVQACAGTGCSYYRQRNNLSKARERLRSLDEKTQETIARKYYCGARPWLDSTSEVS